MASVMKAGKAVLETWKLMPTLVNWMLKYDIEEAIALYVLILTEI